MNQLLTGILRVPALYKKCDEFHLSIYSMQRVPAGSLNDHYIDLLVSLVVIPPARSPHMLYIDQGIDQGIDQWKWDLRLDHQFKFNTESVENTIPFLLASNIVDPSRWDKPVFPVLFDTSSRYHFLQSSETSMAPAYQSAHPFLKWDEYLKYFSRNNTHTFSAIKVLLCNRLLAQRKWNFSEIVKVTELEQKRRLKTVNYQKRNV